MRRNYYDVLNAVIRFKSREGRSPNYVELIGEVGSNSTSSIRKALESLASDGYIRYGVTCRRLSITVLKQSPKMDGRLVGVKVQKEEKRVRKPVVKMSQLSVADRIEMLGQKEDEKNLRSSIGSKQDNS